MEDWKLTAGSFWVNINCGLPVPDRTADSASRRQGRRREGGSGTFFKNIHMSEHQVISSVMGVGKRDACHASRPPNARKKQGRVPTFSTPKGMFISGNRQVLLS